MIVQLRQVNELFSLWSNIRDSKLVIVDQSRGNFVFEFVINANSKKCLNLYREVKEKTLKKIPCGSISFIGYEPLTVKDKKDLNAMSTQFKKFRVEFIDAEYFNNNKLDKTEFLAKLELYLNELKTTLRAQYGQK
jgi:hypothetical protein